MLAVCGAMIAGCFGIAHDQITFTISPEYFTRMKFDQFRAMDFGFPPRVLVLEIGFLATWWVGLIATWFLARVALPKFRSPVRLVLLAVLAIVGFVIILDVFAGFAGPSLLADRSGWLESFESMGVTDPTAFCRVSAIHIASYAGAFLGWTAMMAWLVIRRGTA